MGTGKKILVALAAVVLLGVSTVALVLYLPPRAPEGINCKMIYTQRSNHLQIEWEPVSRADEYIVYQAKRLQGPYKELSRTKETVVQSLEYTTGTWAWYKVSATRRDIEGKGSEPVCFSFPEEVRLNFNYVGNAHNGKMDGQGTYTYDDGVVYTGTFSYDAMTGMGRIEWLDGCTYVGLVRDGSPHGEGVMEWRNGDIYIGEFRSGKRNGEGTLTWHNGDMYSGQWKADLRTGKGTYLWADGTWYEGDFLYDEFSGYGTLYSNEGVLSGYWEKDELIEER